MNKKIFFSAGIAFLLFALLSCSDGSKERRMPNISKKMLMNVNKKLVDRDMVEIKRYADSLGLKMKTTKSGLWYKITKDCLLYTS